MPNFIPDVGKIASLDMWLANLPATLVAELYELPTSISAATVFSDFVMATFGGYTGPQSIGGWGASSIVAGRAQTVGSALQWQHDSGVSSSTIYGLVVYDSATSVVWWVSPRPGGPLLVNLPLQLVSVLPIYTRTSEF